RGSGLSGRGCAGLSGSSRSLSGSAAVRRTTGRAGRTVGLTVTEAAEASASAALAVLACRHALLEGSALFRRHCCHPFFHPLAAFFGSHVRVEPAPTAETAGSSRPALSTWSGTSGTAGGAA